MKVSVNIALWGSMITISYLLLLLWEILPEREVSGWGMNISRNALDYLHEEVSPQILPKYFCDKNVFLLVMVCSAPENFAARKAIRETWGSKNNIGNTVSVQFFIGETLNMPIQREILLESIQFGDIIQENFIDSYYNLTLKSIHMLKVSVKYCGSSTKFMFKVDDDVFVNIPKLLEVLRETKNPKDLLLGRKACGTRPIKNRRSKWYTPRYIYGEDFLPNFLSGTGYLMSLNVAERLYETAKSTPIMHLEDVYTTGICARNAAIIPEHNNDFTYDDFPDETCILKDLITIHYFCPTRMRKTFKEINKERILQSCGNYETMFNAPRWLFSNILMPTYRLGRKRVCQ